jgi:hypothetical protein
VTSNLKQLPSENIKNEKFLFSFFVGDFKMNFNLLTNKVHEKYLGKKYLGLDPGKCG